MSVEGMCEFSNCVKSSVSEEGIRGRNQWQQGRQNCNGREYVAMTTVSLRPTSDLKPVSNEV